MVAGHTVFWQLMDLLPKYEFHQCILRYRGDYRLRRFSYLDQLLLEPGAFYIMDRGTIDFARLYGFTQSSAFFVIRAQRNLDSGRRSDAAVDKSTG